jgi:hypothetical protein
MAIAAQLAMHCDVHDIAPVKLEPANRAGEFAIFAVHGLGFVARKSVIVVCSQSPLHAGSENSRLANISHEKAHFIHS